MNLRPLVGAAFFGIAGLLVGGMSAAPVAQADPIQSNGLVATTWDCDPGGALTFYLPKATNPHAPYPGFLATTGTLYLVAAAGPIGGQLTYIGQKSGLTGSGTLTCSSTLFDATVVLYPASS